MQLLGLLTLIALNARCWQTACSATLLPSIIPPNASMIESNSSHLDHTHTHTEAEDHICPGTFFAGNRSVHQYSDSSTEREQSVNLNHLHVVINYIYTIVIKIFKEMWLTRVCGGRRNNENDSKVFEKSLSSHLVTQICANMSLYFWQRGLGGGGRRGGGG